LLHTLFPTLPRGSLAIACHHAPTDTVSRLEPDRVKLAHYPTHPHVLRYGLSRQATVYLASRTYRHCLTIRTGPCEARSQRLMLPSAVRLSLSRYCTHQPHPCTVLTATHHIHTRPPDSVPARLAYQRPLVNTYCMFDLRSPHSPLPVTRSGACIDLPGSGHDSSDMSDHEDDAQAARGALGTADSNDDSH
jgi:hypothetical protein